MIVPIFQYFVEAGAMAVRRCLKEDLKRIARATGGVCMSAFIYAEHLMFLQLRVFLFLFDRHSYSHSCQHIRQLGRR